MLFVYNQIMRRSDKVSSIHSDMMELLKCMAREGGKKTNSIRIWVGKETQHPVTHNKKVYMVNHVIRKEKVLQA
jgi:hypothetical protein